MNESHPSLGTERRRYYSSSQGPFYNASNIHLFFGGGERAAVVESLITALDRDSRLLHVHGEPGSGKTMMSLVLADRLERHFDILRYDHRALTPALMLRHLLIELCPQQGRLIGDTDEIGPSLLDKARVAIVEQLERRSSTDRRLLLIIDSPADAGHDLIKLLEDIGSIRVAGKPVLRVVLFRRSDESARQADVDSAFDGADNHFWLRRLTLSEIREYLHHHMLLFDFTQRDLFSAEMAYFIADRSEGVIRSINTLARNAFTIASLEDSDKLSMSHLLMAGLPVRHDGRGETGLLSRHRRPLLALLAASTLVFGIAMVLVIG